MNDPTTRTQEPTTPRTTDGVRGRSSEGPPSPRSDRTEVVHADGPTWSRRHRITFRIFSSLLALLVLAFFSFALLEVVIMWLPDETILSMNTEEYPGGVLVHRSHFMAIGLVAWTMVPAVWVQLRKPWRRVAPLLVLCVMAIAGAIGFGLSGSLEDWIVEDLILTVLLLAFVALHPRGREVFRRPAFDARQLGWSAVGAVPWAIYALNQAELQFRPAVGDLHAGEEHWAVAFMMAVAVITTALVGASDHDGWRLPAWTAALVSAVFGAHSLAFPDLASGLSTPWAVAAITWGGVYALLTVARGRGTLDAVALTAGNAGIREGGRG